MKSAFLFAGQGAQVVGMARDFYEFSPSCKQLFDQANQILEYDLARLCFEGPQEQLNKTDISQPALLVASLCALEAFKSKFDLNDFSVSATCGLSLGEYTALVFAGALTFQDALFLVAKRGEFMQEACDHVKSTMMSVIGLEKDLVQKACRQANGIVCISNINSSTQVVISGEAEAVEKTAQICKDLGARKVIKLEVAGAYHSPLMKSAQEKMSRLLDSVNMSDIKVPVVCNVDAKMIQNPEQIRSALKRQITGCVLWLDSIKVMIANGITRFFEFGPGKVLTGLLKRIDQNVQCYPIENLSDLNSIS